MRGKNRRSTRVLSPIDSLFHPLGHRPFSGCFLVPALAGDVGDFGPSGSEACRARLVERSWKIFAMHLPDVLRVF